MSLFQLGYAIALRRIISNWRLELFLFVGLLLAVALLSSAVVFADLVAEAALRRSLDDASAEQANFSVRTFTGLEDPSILRSKESNYQAQLNFVERRVADPFRPYLRDSAFLVETQTFFFQGYEHLELADELRPRGRVKYMFDLWPDRVEIVAGRWPYSTGTHPIIGTPVELAIDTFGAELLQLGVGHSFRLVPATTSENPRATTARIVGIFERTDPEDEFWYEADREFSYQDDYWTMVPMFTVEDVILERFSRKYPGSHTDMTWYFYLDRDGIRADDVNDIREAVAQSEFDVRRNLPGTGMSSRITDVLDEYEDQLLLARIPMYLMIFLVAAILLYYLAVMAGLIVKSRATEIAMLKSRGTTTPQIGILAFMEGLLLAAPAVALGPLLALGASRALGRLFFESDGGTVSVGLSVEAFLVGLAGALLAVAVLTVSALVASRHGIVEFRQAGARPPQAPFIHRYYLDILLLVVIGLIWWQIQSRGSFLVRPVAAGGDLQLDFSLLIGPVLLLLALGLLVMRVFPWAVALLSRLLEPLGPVWLGQGLRRISRDPVMPGTLVVLLMLATALGVMGSAFSSSLERSQKDRALYAAGANLLIKHDGDVTPVSLLGVSDAAKQVPGAGSASEVKRLQGSVLTNALSVPSVAVLAVESDRFSEVAWYRDDFAGGLSLDDLTRAIVPASVEDGLLLPEDATALSLWARPTRPDPNSVLVARIRDARGYYFDVALGELGFIDWKRLEGAIEPQPPRRRVVGEVPATPTVYPPFTLLALNYHTRFGSVAQGLIFLDQLTAATPRGEKVIAEFETTEGWEVVEDHAAPGLYALETSQSVTLSDFGNSAAFSWVPGARGAKGIKPGSPERPLSAVVSKSLLEVAELQLGETVNLNVGSQTVVVRPVVEAGFLPTLDPEEKPFLMVDLATLNRAANLHEPSRLVGGSNELWVSLNGSENPSSGIIDLLESRGTRVRGSSLASDLVSQRVDQPLVSAGWSGLLVLMFLVLVVASASGVMLFSYSDAKERQTEFALLRTLGFSGRQVNGVAWFNLLIVAVCGIALGTVAGRLVATSLLPVLEVAEEGGRVTPPMVLQTNWGALLVSYSILVGVTVGVVVWLAHLLGRLEIQRVLRIGEA